MFRRHSVVRYARLRLLVRAGPSAEKGVPMLRWMQCARLAAVSKRKLILGEKEERGKERRDKEEKEWEESAWKSERERERERETTVARQCSGIKSHKTHGETLQPGGTKTYNGHNGRWISTVGLRLEGAGIHCGVPSKRLCRVDVCFFSFLQSRTLSLSLSFSLSLFRSTWPLENFEIIVW